MSSKRSASGSIFIPSTSEELAALWRNHYGPNKEDVVLPVEGVLGVVVNRPDVKSTVLSLDLCEIVRETHVAFASSLGHDASYIGGVVWNYNGHGLEGGEAHMPVVTELINERKVLPVPQIAWIRQQLQELHKTTLIIANTSSAFGTEQATIEFLNEHLPGCFDGILFPRNYEGNEALTKGMALQYALRTVGASSVTAVHIDDAPHHNISMVDLRNNPDIKEINAIMPLFTPGANAVNTTIVEPPQGVLSAQGIEDAFAVATNCLTAQVSQ